MSEKNAQPNPDGETPSALDGDEEEEKPPTPPDELWAMLLKACKSGDEGAVKNLIEVEGVVPDHRKIYEEIKQAGRIPGAKVFCKEWGPLQWAVVKGFGGIVNVLLQAGFGDVYAKQESKPDENEFQKVDERGDGAPKKGVSTPLHWAAFKGHLHIVCDLIEYFGYEPNIRDEYGNTPLHLAATGMPAKGSHPSHVKIMEILLANEADIDVKNIHGNVPLALCTNKSGRQVILQRMLNDRYEDVGVETLLSVKKLRSDEQALIDTCNKVESEFATHLLDDLMGSLEAGKRSFVQPHVISRAETLLKTLDAKRELEKSMDELDKIRPCKKSKDAEDLRSCIESAKAASVDKATLTATTELLMRVMSEVKLYQNIAQCRQIECANSTHVLQKGRLDKAFNASVKADADANLLQEAQLLLTKMNAEIILKECEEFPWEPTEQEVEGMPLTAQRVLTVQHRIEKLEAALEQGKAEGVGAHPDLISASDDMLVALQKELKDAEANEQKRLAEEEAARLAAAKGAKKKGGKKGRKKK